MTRLKPDEFEIEGEVTEALPNLLFRITVSSGPEEMMGKEILGKLSGQMRMFKIKVMPGDKVKLTITKYDKTQGRITYRSK